MPDPPRTAVSYRLQPASRDRIRTLAEDLRISQAAVVEMGVALLERLTREDLVRLAAKAERRRPHPHAPTRVVTST